MKNYNSPLRKIQITAMMLLILLASIWFALFSQPEQAMKRESDVIRYAPGNLAYEVMDRESENESILVNLPDGQTLVWGA